MTDEEDAFYPGSSTLRRSQGGEAVQLPHEVPEAWEQLGRQFLAAGGVVTLYPISALALALNRKAGTMRVWERHGHLPTPSLRTDSSSQNGRRRMYTKAQVKALQKIAEEEGLMGNKRVYVQDTKFKQRAAELFRGSA